MIIDKIENLGQYFPINDSLNDIYEFVKKNDLKNIAAGSYNVSEKVSVGISEYTPGQGNNPEAHREYWDLQYCITGRERIDVYPIDMCSGSTGYKPDIEFFSEQRCAPTQVALEEGVFAILMPQDAHAPCKALDSTGNIIRKAVFKIKIGD